MIKIIDMDKENESTNDENDAPIDFGKYYRSIYYEEPYLAYKITKNLFRRSKALYSEFNRLCIENKYKGETLFEYMAPRKFPDLPPDMADSVKLGNLLKNHITEKEIVRFTPEQINNFRAQGTGAAIKTFNNNIDSSTNMKDINSNSSNRSIL
ncbi:hypothetical protein GJ496_001414 [Pomphorhynchus laevis]|nr:hypothetical protein GJ496_001414 [Pomphorhynchus laevis]